MFDDSSACMLSFFPEINYSPRKIWYNKCIVIKREVKALLVNKAYKFRIYPTTEQERQIAKTIGCS
ncbi:helix-turn-helix domain-containing protein, partial [Gracilibacillus thailandensis]|uniref:helix-turn-helix domain-containing protein n=1 Tax=Gracilibacillus thailandensis TaxID=563735 RepID=UPI001E56697B